MNPAFAANYYWDTNGTSAGSGAATGNWDSGTTADWTADPTGSTAPGAVTTTTSDNLFFSAGSNGTTGTVTISGTQNANSLTFSNNVALTLSGGLQINLGGADSTTAGVTVAVGDNANNSISTPVVLGANAALANLGTGTLTIEAISDAGGGLGITKKGAGALTLNATNTYTGVTTLNAGVTNLSGAISSSSALALGGGALNYTGAANTQAFNNTTLNSGLGTIFGTSGKTVDLGLVTRNAGGILNVSTATGNVKNAVDATGIVGTWATTGNGTGLQYAAGGSADSGVTSGAITAYSGATAGTAGNLSNVTSASTNYSFGAAATLTGNVTANTLRYTGGAAALANAGFSNAVNGLMNAGTGTLTLSGAGSLLIGTSSAAGNNELDLTNNTQQIAVQSVIANNGSSTGALVLTGVNGAGTQSGSFNLSGVNTYSGGTYVNNTNLILSNNNASPLGLNTASNVLTLNNATLTANTNITNQIANNITVNGAGNVIKLTTNGSNINLSGSLLGSGVLLFDGPGSINGTFHLNMNASSFAGTIILSANSSTSGRIRMESANFGSANAAYVFTGASGSSANATTNFGAGTINFGSMSGSGDFSTNITGAAIVSVGNLGLNDLYTGVMSNGTGTLGLTKVGAGTMTLSGANTFTGGTIINNGTLLLNNAAALSTTGGNISFGGGTLKYGAGITTDYSARITGGTSAGAVAIDTNGNNLNFSTALGATNSGGLTKAGSGTLTLNGNNLYTGATSVTGGKLLLNGTINSTGGVSVSSGATLAGSGLINGTTSVDVGAALTNGNSNTAVLTLGGLTFSGAGGTVNVNTAGSAGIAVTNALTTNGAGVTINVPTAPAWVNDTTYNLISYGSFSGSASDFVLGTVSGLGARQSATIGNSGSAITLAIAGDTPFWTGAASGAWSTNSVGAPYNWQLQTAGTGTEFLTNDQVLFNDNATGTTSVDISAGNVTVASVNFANSNKDYTISSSGGFGIAGAGATLSKSGTGTVTINTNNTYTGATSVSDGTLILAGNNTYTGQTSVSGGNLIITGTSSGTSGVVITGGTFQLGNGGATGSLASGVAIANGGSLVFDLSNTVAQGTDFAAISGTGTLTQAGSGNLTLNAVNTYTGNTAINSGTLSVVGSGQLGSGSYAGNISNNGAFVYNSSAAQTVSGTISGNGTLSQNGPGTLTLSGNNNYSGGTNINAGAVSVGNNNALGTGTVTLNGGGLTNSAVVTIANNLVVGASGATLSVGTSNDFSLSGTLSGAGNININSTGFPKSLNWNFAANTMTSGTITMANGGTNTTVFRLNNPAATSSAVDWVLGGASDRGMPIGASGTYNFGSLGGSGILQSNASGMNITLSIGGNNHDATFSGKIQDNGSPISVVKVGTGNETFSGANNNYSGSTTVNGGTLTLSNNFGASSSMNVNNGGTLVVGGTFSGAGAFAVNNGGTVTVNGNKTGAGTVTVANGGTLNGTGSVSGTVNISGALSGSVAAAGDLVLNDTGSMSDAHTLSGNVALNNSVLANVTSDIAIAAGKTLSGVGGSVGTVSATALGSVIAPGNSGIGNLSMNNLNTATGAHLSMDILGTTAGGYDTVTVGNTIDLNNGGDLTLNIGSFTPGLEAIYLVINSQGGAGTAYGTYGAFDSITFTGAGTGSLGSGSGAEGTELTINGMNYTLTYQADFEGSALTGGNDIALLAVPEPSTWAMLVGGLGMLLSFQRSRRRN